MPRIKICGITRREDAIMACDLGADALGFIFYPGSPRCISCQAAAEIVSYLPQTVARIGVFVNPDPAIVTQYARDAGLTAIQIHGHQSKNGPISPASLPVIYAFQVKATFDVEMLTTYRDHAAALLLDAYKRGRFGGTGATFNWDVAVRATKQHRIILAGGLTPDNIVLAVEKVNPYALDVNSGIEESPGKKDHRKLKRLFSNLKPYRQEGRADEEQQFPLA